MNIPQALFAALFSVLILVSAEVQAMDVPAEAPPGAPTPSGLYTPADLYVIDRGEKRTVQLYPRALVVRPFVSPDTEAEKFAAFLKEMGFTQGNGIRVERLSAILGTQESKMSIAKKNYVVVYFPKAVDVFALITKMAKSSSVWEAHPVFAVDGDYVFPAGIWVRTKTITPESNTFLRKRIQSFGYAIPWEKRPVGLDKNTTYYVPVNGVSLNLFAMSRLIAEDLVVERATPDFVSIQPLVRVTREVSRVSGVMQDRFTFTYAILYNSRRVAVDTEKVKQWDPAMLMPEGVLDGTFKLEPIRVTNEHGVATIAISIRLYQPGDFDLTPPPVFYSIVGAGQDTPPLEVRLGKTGFKVLGLVPRTDKGEPKLTDVYDIKRMPMPAVGMPPAPVAETFPKSDYRYWTGQFVTNNPDLVRYARTGGGALAIFSAAGLLIIGGVYAGCVFVKRKKAAGPRFAHAYAAHLRTLQDGAHDDAAKVLTMRYAHIELRRILGCDEGASRREMLPRLSPHMKPVCEAALAALDKAATTEPMTADALREVRAHLAIVRKAQRVDRMRTFMRYPLSAIQRKKAG